MKLTLRLFIAFLFSLSASQISATHLMGGNITYECVGNNTYEFTVELYRDCNGINLGNTVDLNLTSASCGQNINITLELIPSGAQIVTPICSTQPDACNGTGGPYGIHKYVYKHIPAAQGTGQSSLPVVLPACNDWVISYDNCCRNNAITTLANSGSAFYISTTLDNVTAPCNDSPTFGFDPILYAAVGDTVSYSHGVFDADNDSLVFNLIPCAGSSGTPLSYASGLSATSPLMTNYSNFNSSNGTYTFVPTVPQVGVICMSVEQYQNGAKIGEVVRDIQIAVFSSSNQSPTLSGINGTNSNSISTCAGQNVCFTIDAFDANTAQNVGLSYTNSLPGATYTVNNTGNTAQVTICWTPTLNDLGTNHFGLSVFDDACPILGKGNYNYTVEVTGVGGGATFNQTTIYQGTSTQFQINLLDTACAVTWSPSATLSCTNCQNPTATPQTTTTYYYQISCPNGSCGSISDSIVVTVLIPKTLTGVISQSNGAPLANSIVSAYNAQGTVIATDTTDAMGNYTLLTNDNTFFVAATPATVYFDQTETYYNQATTLSAATAFTFANGSTTGTLNFSTIEVAKTISGMIFRSNGMTLVISKVYLLDNTFNVLDSVVTSLTGQYSFTTYENSIHLLAIPSVTYPNEIPTFYTGASDTANATLITFTSLQTNLNFSTLEAPPSIVGTISRADNTPLNNSWVHLIDSSLVSIDSMLTTAQGAYGFVVPDASIDYYIKAVPGSSHGDQVITYYNGSETIQAANPITITTILNVADFNTIDTFSLTGGKSIGGIVSLGTDFTTTPLAEVRLILKDETGQFINDAITDDNGEFKFYNLVDGSYTIMVDKVGIDNELSPMVTLTANEPSLDNLEFLLHSYYLEMLDPSTTVEAFNAQNVAIYPNPVQTTFMIQYDLSAAANVNIEVLDVNGRLVTAVINEKQAAGEHLLEVNKSDKLNQGVYFVRLTVDGKSMITRIVKL